MKHITETHSVVCPVFADCCRRPRLGNARSRLLPTSWGPTRVARISLNFSRCFWPLCKILHNRHAQLFRPGVYFTNSSLHWHYQCLTIPINVRSITMAEAAVTSKGQITIPVEIRKQMNLAPHDKVVFTLLPNGTTVMRAKNRSVTSLAGSITSKKKRIAIKYMKMR